MQHVWISETPKAFITRSSKFLGGQIEITGEMCVFDATINNSYDLFFVKFDDVYSINEKGEIYGKTLSNDKIFFQGQTSYTDVGFICRSKKHSKSFAGQKIVFTKYEKDEVTPAEFGFDLEEWDYFVPVEMREESASSSPEETPAPTPVPEPTPAPTALPEQGSMYLSTTDAIPSRQSFPDCRKSAIHFSRKQTQVKWRRVNVQTIGGRDSPADAGRNGGSAAHTRQRRYAAQDS